MASPFTADQPFKENNVINESERDSGTPANDEGKLVQLEADGKFSSTFIFQNFGTLKTAGEDLTANTPVTIALSGDGADVSIEQLLSDQQVDSWRDTHTQTFTTDAGAANLKTITLRLQKIGSPTADFSLKLLKDSRTGPVIKTVSVPAASISTTTGDVEFSFNVSIQNNATYAFQIPFYGDSVDYVKISIQDSNVYAGGTFFIDDTVLTGDGYFRIVQEKSEIGKLYASGTGGLRSGAFVGFVQGAVSKDEAVPVIVNGIVEGFSALDLLSEYYVQDTIGTIGTTSTSIKVGLALSATEILIEK